MASLFTKAKPSIKNSYLHLAEYRVYFTELIELIEDTTFTLESTVRWYQTTRQNKFAAERAEQILTPDVVDEAVRKSILACAVPKENERIEIVLGQAKMVRIPPRSRNIAAPSHPSSGNAASHAVRSSARKAMVGRSGVGAGSSKQAPKQAPKQAVQSGFATNLIQSTPQLRNTPRDNDTNAVAAATKRPRVLAEDHGNKRPRLDDRGKNLSAALGQAWLPGFESKVADNRRYRDHPRDESFDGSTTLVGTIASQGQAETTRGAASRTAGGAFKSVSTDRRFAARLGDVGLGGTAERSTGSRRSTNQAPPRPGMFKRSPSRFDTGGSC